MNYLIVFNNIKMPIVNPIHETITKNIGVTDWWHYLPNVYIVISGDTEATLSNRIIARHPGLLFLIIAVDLKHYNGVLDKRAWEWIKKKGNTFVKLRSVPQPQPITQTLSGYLGLPPIKPVSNRTSLDDILDQARDILKKRGY